MDENRQYANNLIVYIHTYKKVNVFNVWGYGERENTLGILKLGKTREYQLPTCMGHGVLMDF